MVSTKGLYVSMGLVFAVLMGFILFLNLHIASGDESKRSVLTRKTAHNPEPHSSWLGRGHAGCLAHVILLTSEVKGNSPEDWQVRLPEGKGANFWCLHIVVVILQKPWSHEP